MKKDSFNRKLEQYIYNKISNITNTPAVETLYGSNGVNRTYIPSKTVHKYEIILGTAKLLYEAKYKQAAPVSNKLMSEEDYIKLKQIVDDIFNIATSTDISI